MNTYKPDLQLLQHLKECISGTVTALSVSGLQENVRQKLVRRLVYLLGAEHAALGLPLVVQVDGLSDTIFPDISELDRAAGELKPREVFGEQPASAEPEWIEWKGGVCPVRDGADVEVRFRTGGTERDDSPQLWIWSHADSPHDIVAYRVWSK